jgi:hypothetical protein
MFKVTRSGVAAATIATGVVLAAGSVAIVLGQDPRVGRCPVEGNRILATFEIPAARDYTRYIPRMLRSPELERDSPAFVVIFDGPARLTVSGSVPGDGVADAMRTATEVFSGVVCVVVDGAVTVYTDVATTDWSRP